MGDVIREGDLVDVAGRRARVMYVPASLRDCEYGTDDKTDFVEYVLDDGGRPMLFAYPSELVLVSKPPPVLT